MANYHAATIAKLTELVAAAGLDSLDKIEPKHINRRVQGTEIKSYSQLYPTIEAGCLLNASTIPDNWTEDWNAASATSW